MNGAAIAAACAFDRKGSAGYQTPAHRVSQTVAKKSTPSANPPRTFRAVAMYNPPPAYAEARRREPVTRFGPGTATSRATKTKQPVQIADIRAEPAYANDPQRLVILELAGARTLVAVPMLKEDEVVGVISIYRQEVQPFTDKQIALVQNFAAQA